MRNYNVYLSGMAQGLADKLFFINRVNLSDFDQVVDFGCGGGEILRALQHTNLQLIGIDHDPYMRSVAKTAVPTASFYDHLTRDMINERTLIIFSSVLHEVEDYWDTLENIIKGTGCTVVVRDMRYSATVYPISLYHLARLVRHANQEHLADFIMHWGMSTEKDLYHYLLKYSYVDNWELEVKEDYFSFDYSRLLRLGEVLYEQNFVLPFKHDQVYKDFGIELDNPTHTKLIIKIACE